MNSEVFYRAMFDHIQVLHPAETTHAGCDYCGHPFESGRHTCPSCGAPMRYRESGVPIAVPSALFRARITAATTNIEAARLATEQQLATERQRADLKSARMKASVR